MAFKPLSCVFGKFTIQQRYVMIFMMHFAILNAYHLRVVLNIAMTEMLEPKNHTIDSDDACPQYNFSEIKHIQGGKYNWPHNVEALILYAFYIGYLLSHVPGGWLADMFGARHVMGGCMLLSTVITILYPLAIDKGGHWAAVVLRIFLGLAQGPLYPAISTMMQCWVPAHERGLLGGIAYGGSNLGTITGNILTGLMIDKFSSWVVPFYVWGGCSLIWYIFYLFMVFSEPKYHPFVTEEEREYLEKELVKKQKISVPWKKMFSSGPFWALFAGQFGHDYLIFSMVTDLSKYFNNILKMDIKMNAIFTAIPFFFIWISSIISAFLADWVVNKQYLRVVTARRIWTAVSALGSGAILVVTVYIGCSRTFAIVLYTVAMFLHGPFYSGMKVNVNDLTMHYGGTVMALVNGFGALAGIIGPCLIGLLTPNHSLGEWQLVFWIMLGVMTVTTVIYWIFASGERQAWDYPEETE